MRRLKVQKDKKITIKTYNKTRIANNNLKKYINVSSIS
jgi:hypothetical protein